MARSESHDQASRAGSRNAGAALPSGDQVPVLRSRVELASYLSGARSAGRRVSVVPTMGALHAGHQALVGEAKKHGEEVIVTVFVNPTQFGPGEDLERYPRTLDQDVQRAAAAGATAVFHPEAGEMYPPGEQTRLQTGSLAAHLCGASRPVHFGGVLTVVAKLMNLCGPSTFVFGRKDFQQLRVIQRMVADLFFPVTVVEYPIVREPDGLALSSRNVYLSADERQRALAIPRALAHASAAFDAGVRADELRASVVAGLIENGLLIDYVELADDQTLQPYPEKSVLPERLLLAVAVLCGSTRLIDNLLLGVDAPPEVL